MSWGATGFTPIVTYNVPPFGFAELPTLPDFKTCNENPWSTGERVKADIQDALLVQEYRKALEPQGPEGPDKYDKAQELKCVTDTCSNIQEQFTMPFTNISLNDRIFDNYSLYKLIVLLFIAVVVIMYLRKYK